MRPAALSDWFETSSDLLKTASSPRPNLVTNPRERFAVPWQIKDNFHSTFLHRRILSLSKRPVSLDAFAKWALSHHSRRYFISENYNSTLLIAARFAHHKTFMYLFYDVIQIRKSSLANKILIKRQNWKSTTKDISSLTLQQLQTARNAVAAGRKVEDPVVKRLQKNILAIGKHVPGSFAQKLMM